MYQTYTKNLKGVTNFINEELHDISFLSKYFSDVKTKYEKITGNVARDEKTKMYGKFIF